jgi:hypothetical protein
LSVQPGVDMANGKGRFAAALIATLSILLAFPGTASANIVGQGSLQVSGINVVVDAPGHAAVLTATNANTSPQHADSNTITNLSAALGCGAVRNLDNLCPIPDVGVITTDAVATGVAGTACAGRTFNVTGPDASGVYTFAVVGAAVVLAPPGGAAGSNLCSVQFPLYFRRAPAADSNGAAGLQTRINARARQVHNLSPTTVTSYPSVEITIAAPAGGNGVADFNGDGSTDRGVYRNGAWLVHNQTTVFHGLAGDIPVPADYDGNGTTDRVVWREGAWYHHTKPTAYWGLPGDIPVPGDYNGDGKADRAVYRDGAWFVEGQPTVFFGLPNDIPVPGNYDADPQWERAVYRDGAWFVEGQATQYLGLPGDIPVPSDYNGDGDLERAVYRNGIWFREGLSTVYWGLAGDVPVPADYSGDDISEVAVYRDGAWHVAGFTVVYYGLPDDIPLPLPQAVYRKFF